ncbi:hypothetical protein LCGC14_2619740 [marine sediment metagenome]|uniref:Uncharacterized protein n=1 Tax=marine sediment metagenome TaxID=412755 RepID=A0A0F9A3N4_9ZZZZ
MFGHDNLRVSRCPLSSVWEVPVCEKQQVRDYNMSRYLEFSPAAITGKTKLIVVFSKLHKTHLGVIKWLGRWRQYAFFPLPDTAFNPECMADISEQIKFLQDEWKAKR